ncbi:hypothetical protein GF407_08240 [candidate division KSB1 bacterium]|nr:hypothetical protein [candidate division KSB1 bacterium]
MVTALPAIFFVHILVRFFIFRYDFGLSFCFIKDINNFCIGCLMSSETLNDNISGASEIFNRAALFLIEQIKDLTESENDSNRILHIAKKILYEQPRMAPLYHLLNLTLVLWQEYGSSNQDRGKLIRHIEEVIDHEKKAGKRIIQHLFPLTDQKTIAVFSRSSTILDALLYAHEQGAVFRVFITEARPNLEGHKTAMDLANAGIETTLVVDAALSHVVRNSDFICVGADRISETSVINKIGTKALALLSREATKPIYVISSENKFLPDQIKMRDEALHPSSEIDSEQRENLHYWNKYFEDIPLTLFTGVISESGMLTTANVRKRIQGLNLQALQALLQKQ